jgi:hypothetical protein
MMLALKSHDDFVERQRLAWDRAREAIDEGLPCYGWELEIPEFYVVYGYDDEGYYFSGPGCDSGKGPKPWQEVGDTGIGVLEMYVVEPGEAAGARATVKEALAFALEHAEGPAKWTFPKYRAGLAGFDAWIEALRTGPEGTSAEGFRAFSLGAAYNAAVWSECRGFAVQFLREAKKHIGDGTGSLFDEAIGHYESVGQSLRAVAEAFPFHGRRPEHIQDEAHRQEAIEHLRAARSAEESGLAALERILGQL